MVCYSKMKPICTPPLQQSSPCPCQKEAIVVWNLKAVALTHIHHYTVAIGRGQGTDPIYNPNFWPCFWKEAQEDQTVKCLKNSFYSSLISIHIRENGSFWARAFSYFRNLSSFSKALTWIPLSLSFYCYYYFFLTPRCWYNLFISCHDQQLVTKKKIMVNLKMSGSVHRTCLTLADFFTFFWGDTY